MDKQKDLPWWADERQQLLSGVTLKLFEVGDEQMIIRPI